MAWGKLQEVGKHTLVDQIRRCVQCLWLCTWIRVPRTSIMDVLRKQLFQLSSKSWVVHQPTLCTLWGRLGHVEKLPTDEHVWTGIITCGGVRRGSGLRVCGGALALPFTDFPSWGTSESEAGKAGYSPTVGSEEEAALLPSGSERGFSSSKRRGEVDGGGDSGLESGPVGGSPSAGGKKSEEVPNKGEQNRNWLPHHYLLWGPKEGGNAASPMHSRGSPMPSAGSKKSEVVRNKGEQNQKWLPHHYLL